jgi:hypothetical protein
MPVPAAPSCPEVSHLLENLCHPEILHPTVVATRLKRNYVRKNLRTNLRTNSNLMNPS